MSSKTYRIPHLKVRMVRDGAKLKVSAPTAAAEVVRQVCCEDPCTETMVALFIDGANNIRGVTVVAQGGRHGLVVRAAEILRPALIAGAAAIVLGHNHPSGDTTPSREDDVMTRHVKEAADVIGVPLVDHVIVTEHASDGSYSYLEEGRL